MFNRIIRFLWPAAGAFAAIFLLFLFEDATGLAMLMAPFGASCVIVFALPDSPLAKPRNVIGGHLISTLTGLSFFHVFGHHAWTLAAAVALSIAFMQITKTIHPPAGADPLVVILSGAGWSFLLTPVLAGALLLVALSAVYRVLQQSSQAKQAQVKLNSK
ncbi:HPP family protein [Paenibacillus glycanilyticus]|uniref:HPP family protein n=1 Tax=Paenibacillus glycanilyticus TaxID=126569 RepID=UPI00203D862A|nr:HPP family protein [Paenibacillus glycanilyticus]MCM3629667.1 HPP family protein [Paenibacillus glycanilyticus]